MHCLVCISFYIFDDSFNCGQICKVHENYFSGSSFDIKVKAKAYQCGSFFSANDALAKGKMVLTESKNHWQEFIAMLFWKILKENGMIFSCQKILAGGYWDKKT